jgi:hypothetical protein
LQPNLRNLVERERPREIEGNGSDPGRSAGHTAAAADGVDPVPGGATVTAKWKASVKAALIRLSMSEVSADAAMADHL